MGSELFYNAYLCEALYFRSGALKSPRRKYSKGNNETAIYRSPPSRPDICARAKRSVYTRVGLSAGKSKARPEITTGHWIFAGKRYIYMYTSVYMCTTRVDPTGRV